MNGNYRKLLLIHRSNSLLRTKQRFRSSSYYVNKARTLEWLKNDDSALLAESKRGYFLVFFNNQPLLTPKSDAFGYNISFIPQNTLKSVIEDIGVKLEPSSLALIDAVPMQGETNDTEEEWEPVFAVSLPCPSSFMVEKMKIHLEDTLGGHFVDPRLAMLSTGSVEQAQKLAKGQILLKWKDVFLYCPKCSGPVEMKVSKTLAYCRKCDKQYHPPVSPVAICLVTDEKNENCILVRVATSRKGVFTAIAGFSEPGEPMEETAKREIAEEVGMDVTGVYYAGSSQSWPFPYGSLMCGYHATADRGQIVGGYLLAIHGHSTWCNKSPCQKFFDHDSMLLLNLEH